MGTWKYKLNIKQFINPSEPFEGVQKLLVKYLKRYKERFIELEKKGKFSGDFDQIIFDLEGSNTVGEFDGALSELYDYGDANDIWLG